MAYNKGLHGSSGGSHRGRPYALMLLIAFGAALLGVMVLHKLRETRIYNLLVKEKDNQILDLQLLLQKERDHTKELRNKNEEMKGKIYGLRIQKMELDRRVVEMQSTMDSLRDEQKVMESAFEEKQSELRTMEEKGVSLGQEGNTVTELRENLKQKEAEIQDLKYRLEIPVKTMIPETVTGNGTAAAAQDQTENEIKGKEEEHSLDTAKYEGGDGKHIVNDDASESSKLTVFKDGEVTVGAKDEIQNDEKPREESKDPRDNGGAEGGATSRDTEAEVVDGREKKAIREEQPGQLEHNTNAGDEYSKVRQLEGDSGAAAAGVKRKRGRVSRTKGKRWKTIVKNKLMEINGISESHAEVQKRGNRKVYRHENDGELKSRRRVSDEGNTEREDEGWDNSIPIEDEPRAILLKPEKHETNDGRSMIVNDKNHEVRDNDNNTLHQEKEKLDEIRQAENKEDSFVHQNWSRRHINKASKDGGRSKSNASHEEPEETEASGVQKQEKFMNEDEDEEEENDDFFKDPQSDVEDEKEEYKEEIEESEFQPDL